jgi:hypothetical protein
LEVVEGVRSKQQTLRGRTPRFGEGSISKCLYFTLKVSLQSIRRIYQGTSIRERLPQKFEPKRFSPPRRQGKMSKNQKVGG